MQTLDTCCASVVCGESVHVRVYCLLWGMCVCVCVCVLAVAGDITQQGFEKKKSKLLAPYLTQQGSTHTHVL